MNENTETTLVPIIRPLLIWYEENHRTLPWRENTQPYYVWISEIMLQQTRVETVIAYFRRFLEHAPDIKTLSLMSEDEVMKLWEGLGYYSRARNLLKCAQFIEEKYLGIFPDSYEDILALPGIGEYTAGAIASICYNLPTPAIDANVLRVVTRLLNLNEVSTGIPFRRKIYTILEEIYNKTEPSQLTQALIEIGALICKKNPKCDECPLICMCEAKKHGTFLKLPVKPAKKKRRIENRAVLILLYENEIAIRKRNSNGLLAGLWEFPNFIAEKEDDVYDYLKKTSIPVRDIECTFMAKHIFSHIEWHMKGYVFILRHKDSRFTWITKEDMHKNYSIPSAFSAFKKFIEKRPC